MAADRTAGADRPMRIPALDGLRGLALVGILLFHADLVQGGFLSVDTFFALSGFLITTLLVREWDDTGTIRLRSFWARRSRRLVPALVVLLAGISLYAVVFADAADLGAIRGGALATAGYVANWHAIAVGQGYWDRFATPSPLTHAWTLAVEEQFYLVWPLVVVGVLRLARGRVRALVALSSVGAVLSAVWMAVLYDPEAEPSRVYLGTDTRAAALLLGAGLAGVLHRVGPIVGAAGRRALDVAAAVSLVVLACSWAAVDGLMPALYRGGFIVLCLPVVVIIAATAQPVPLVVGRVLGWAPLRWLGTISYGAYLWHWPAFLVVRAQFPDLAPVPRFALQMGATLPLAVVSYQLVERPIHRRGLAALPHNALAPVAIVAVLAAVLVTTAGPPPVVLPDASHDAGALTAPLPAVAPEGTPRRVLLVGDSLGWFLGQELVGHADRYGVTPANRALAGCFLGRGTGRVRYEGAIIEEEPGICRTWPTRWADDAATFRPDDVYVVFGNFGDGEREIDGAWYGPCTATFAAWYGDELRLAISVLGATGAAVHVATVPYPRFPFLPRSLDANTDCMNRIIVDTVTHAAPGTRARVVDLASWVCPTADSCARTRDGVNLRPDGVHFEGEGAAVALRQLLAAGVAP